ncbi:uncharacterized protein LY79DRAFT_549617 [Colletotrichum navitas]|uniref:Uncharacterized protein n=1 Tax=Colletotrichum navitas TaxID=681940 RepID=A0AAD8Q212_9PEZI|nr:uncharacterized protein LY79DRAFT_549617 [Colletotrichum navitas]KAK1594391.1 hypothetical protein LY79DRAFT_549617 [Colletotrichum navitas]
MLELRYEAISYIVQILSLGLPSCFFTFTKGFHHGIPALDIGHGVSRKDHGQRHRR